METITVYHDRTDSTYGPETYFVNAEEELPEGATYVLFYVPELASDVVAVIHEDGAMFTTDDWQGMQPEPDELGEGFGWVYYGPTGWSQDTIVIDGLPRLVPGATIHAEGIVEGETFSVDIDADRLEAVEDWMTDLWETEKGLEGTARELISQKLDGADELLKRLGWLSYESEGRVKVGIPNVLRESDWTGVSNAAEILGVSEQRVRQYLTEPTPRLKGKKVGKTWMVSRASLRRLAEKRA